VEIDRGREITLEADGIVAYADGERFAPLPMALETVPGAVTVLVPPGT
jgi:diacylglycerol kinase (ATP)